MSSPMLHIKPEEVDTIQKRRSYTICIIGCKQLGALHTCLFADAGFNIICADANQTRIERLMKGKLPLINQEIGLKLKNFTKTEFFSATNDLKTAVSKSDVIIITVPVEFDKKRKANYSNIESTCKLVGSKLRQGALIIIVSIIGIGAMQGLIKEVLENNSGLKAGLDFGLAYSPTKIFKGQSLEQLVCQERLVAAADQHSLNAATNILATITKGAIKKTENVKIAEAVMLFEAVLQDVNVALANELAIFCEKVGIDYFEAYKIAKNSTNNNFSLPVLTCEKAMEEPYLLLGDAENLNLKLRIPTTAREVNETVIKHAVNLTKDALTSCGKTLRRAKVSILGITQIPNMKSPPKRTVKELAKSLEAKGAKVSLYDPYFVSDTQMEMQCNIKKTLQEVLEGADCALILTGHEQFKSLNLKRMKLLMKMPAAIVDFANVVNHNKAEEEGFIFRGFGRGVWKK